MKSKSGWKLLMRKLLTLSISIVTAQSEGVYFGTVNLFIQSQNEASKEKSLLFSVLYETTGFLEEAIREEYNSSSIYQLSHVTLTVDDFIYEEIDSKEFNVVANLQGFAFFEENLPDSYIDITRIVRRALDDRSKTFINFLKRSSDSFLQGTLFVVTTTISDGEQDTNRASNADYNDPETSTSLLAPWITILPILVGLGVLFILTCFTLYFYSRDGRFNTLSTATMLSLQTASRSSAESSNGVLDKPTPSILSPVSITSQDSSQFTYNPNTNEMHEIASIHIETVKDDENHHFTFIEEGEHEYGTLRNSVIRD